MASCKPLLWTGNTPPAFTTFCCPEANQWAVIPQRALTIAVVSGHFSSSSSLVRSSITSNSSGTVGNSRPNDSAQDLRTDCNRICNFSSTLSTSWLASSTSAAIGIEGMAANEAPGTVVVSCWMLVLYCSMSALALFATSCRVFCCLR